MNTPWFAHVLLDQRPFFNFCPEGGWGHPPAKDQRKGVQGVYPLQTRQIQPRKGFDGGFTPPAKKNKQDKGSNQGFRAGN